MRSQKPSVSVLDRVAAARKSRRAGTKLYLVGLLLLLLGACTRTAQAPAPSPERAESPLAALAITESKLIASDGASNDDFGHSVAISGDTAVIGARGDDDVKGTDSGAAYVFVRTASGWSERAKLLASDWAAGDGFGTSVAISGDIIVVGAFRDDSSRGAAYVFTLNGTAWNQQAKLTASDRGIGDSFGTSVAIRGGTAIVGASNDDNERGSDAVLTYSCRVALPGASRPSSSLVTAH